MTVETLTPFVIAMIVGAAYAALWFLAKVGNVDKPETWTDFNLISLIVTVSFGAGIGILNVYSGQPVTQSDLFTQIAYYGVEIAAVREFAYVVWSRISARFKTFS